MIKTSAEGKGAVRSATSAKAIACAAKMAQNRQIPLARAASGFTMNLQRRAYEKNMPAPSANDSKRPSAPAALDLTPYKDKDQEIARDTETPVKAFYTVRGF